FSRTSIKVALMVSYTVPITPASFSLDTGLGAFHESTSSTALSAQMHRKQWLKLRLSALNSLMGNGQRRESSISNLAVNFRAKITFVLTPTPVVALLLVIVIIRPPRVRFLNQLLECLRNGEHLIRSHTGTGKRRHATYRSDALRLGLE